ncbi:MAG TPA: hypothetical protein VLZ30_05285 [Verrucomicrobiae bacterium]|nr:hypothetical protein [Verrucomicrobiae bacterium]
MREYSDPEQTYTISYPEGWLPLTHEGSPHVSLASLTTGGYLKIEACQFEKPTSDAIRPERALRSLLECEKRSWPAIEDPVIQRSSRGGAALAYMTFTRTEPEDEDHLADFGHARAWVFSRGRVQVRCLYRCRSSDAGVDDEELDEILGTLELRDEPHLDTASFTNYYFSLLKRHRPQLSIRAPEGLALTLADGQTVLLEHLYHHYLLEPHRMDELIESHINLLDYCGDDVPDLKNYKQIRPLLFPKIFRAASRNLPPHRLSLWPGIAIGAVIQGAVFTYGVNSERLKNWSHDSLDDILDDLIDNLYGIQPIAPRGLRTDEGVTQAISYVDHAFSASFILFEDFYTTTSHNLSTDEFLVGLPDPSCVSCFRDDDPRFVVQHTAMLRWDYHRSVERLTDTIYLVSGPTPKDVKPYDILHCCPKKA